jgi:hypothetical protein
MHMSIRLARRAPAIVFAALILAAGCESGNEVNVSASAALTSVHVDLPTALLEPVVVGTEAGLFVVGGYEIDAEVLTSAPDVYFMASDGDAWSHLAPVPFDKPLYFPGAAPLDDGLLIVGVPCGPTSIDSVVATCPANRLVGAQYSISDLKWHEVAVPDWLQVASGSSPILARNIGTLSSGSVVFLVGQGTSLVYAAYDASGHAWTRIDVPDELLLSGNVCVVNGELVVLSSGLGDPEGADPGAIDATPIVVSTLKGTEWVVDKFDKPFGANSERIICDNGAAGYIGFDASAHFATVLWREVSGWKELPPPAIDDPTGLSAGRLGSAPFIHQRDPDGGTVHVFDSDTNAWVTHETIRGEVRGFEGELLVVGADAIELFVLSQ